MKETIEALNIIAKESSRNRKEELLKKFDSPKLRFLLRCAFDPYILFGVKKIEKNYMPRLCVPTLEELEEITEPLITREITGNAARDLLSMTLTCEDELATKYLFDIFTKDLSIGATVKTINKVFPKLIPTFDIGLCRVFEGEELPKGDWIIEPKYDGLRCVCIIDETGDVNFLSRNGKKLYNLRHIEQAIRYLGLRSVVFDGEAKGKEWNDSQSMLRSSKNKVDSSTLEYHIFDMIDLEQWKNKDTFSLAVRKLNMSEIAFQSPLKEVPYAEIQDYKTAKGVFDKLIERGYEGAVIKDLQSTYSFKKSKDWLKWKETITEDITITGYEEGTGKNVGRLGAFLCDFNGVTVKVGGGFSDEQRETFWATKEDMIGRVIECKSQEVTKDGSLRFPVYVRTREDKD